MKCWKIRGSLESWQHCDRSRFAAKVSKHWVHLFCKKYGLTSALSVTSYDNHWNFGVEVGTIWDQNLETYLEMGYKYLTQWMGYVAQPVQFGNKIQIMFLLESFKQRLHLCLEFPLAQLQHQNKQLRLKQPFWLNHHCNWDLANVSFQHDLSVWSKECPF